MRGYIDYLLSRRKYSGRFDNIKINCGLLSHNGSLLYDSPFLHFTKYSHLCALKCVIKRFLHTLVYTKLHINDIRPNAAKAVLYIRPLCNGKPGTAVHSSRKGCRNRAEV